MSSDKILVSEAQLNDFQEYVRTNVEEATKRAFQDSWSQGLVLFGITPIDNDEEPEEENEGEFDGEEEPGDKLLDMSNSADENDDRFHEFFCPKKSGTPKFKTTTNHLTSDSDSNLNETMFGESLFADRSMDDYSYESFNYPTFFDSISENDLEIGIAIFESEEEFNIAATDYEYPDHVTIVLCQNASLKVPKWQYLRLQQLFLEFYEAMCEYLPGIKDTSENQPSKKRGGKNDSIATSQVGHLSDPNHPKIARLLKAVSLVCLGPKRCSSASWSESMSPEKSQLKPLEFHIMFETFDFLAYEAGLHTLRTNFPMYEAPTREQICKEWADFFRNRTKKREGESEVKIVKS